MSEEHSTASSPAENTNVTSAKSSTEGAGTNYCHFYTTSYPSTFSTTTGIDSSRTTDPQSTVNTSLYSTMDSSSTETSAIGGDGAPFSRLPEKRIMSLKDIETFRSSKTYREIINFIVDLGEAVTGLCVVKESEMKCSEPVAKIIELLGELKDLCDKHPPIQQTMRFGNKAFQGWFDEMKELVPSRLRSILDSKFHVGVPEMALYLTESFGNRTRIDYGTGHEFSFLCFLFCLCKFGVFTDTDKPSIVLALFHSYIKLMRTLQSLYVLEPAGSRGVWGLDDYHFLPFLWGAAQLQVDDPVITPEQVTEPQVVEEYADSYMYVGAIKVILEVKKGVPFGECSPLLNDITQVSSWRKVKSGLLKMYEAELLQKLPVAQHFYFGTLLPFS